MRNIPILSKQDVIDIFKAQMEKRLNYIESELVRLRCKIIDLDNMIPVLK